MMTVEEFAEALEVNDSKEGFDFFSISLHFIHEEAIELTGITSVYEFYYQQHLGWKQYEELPDLFLVSQEYFAKVVENLNLLISKNYSLITLAEQDNRHVMHLLNNFYKNPSLNTVTKSIIQDPVSHRFNFEPANLNQTYIFRPTNPKVKTLLNIWETHPKQFDGAFHYLTDFNNADLGKDLAGAMLVQELIFVQETEATKSKYIAAEAELKDYIKQLTISKEEKEAFFQEWYSKTNQHYKDWHKLAHKELKESQTAHQAFDKTAKDKIAQLEETYHEMLRLAAPAKHWEERAKRLNKQFYILLVLVLVLLGLAVGSLGVLLWNPPEEIFVSFFEKDKSAAIRWSIIYVTFLSFIAFASRSFIKAMFSALHLARDCQERSVLTSFYLSLINEKEVYLDKEERQLIMQALFSRAETGLLKDEGGPSMPNNLLGKVLSGK